MIKIITKIQKYFIIFKILIAFYIAERQVNKFNKEIHTWMEVIYFII